MCELIKLYRVNIQDENSPVRLFLKKHRGVKLCTESVKRLVKGNGLYPSNGQILNETKKLHAC